MIFTVSSVAADSAVAATDLTYVRYAPVGAGVSSSVPVLSAAAGTVYPVSGVILKEYTELPGLPLVWVMVPLVVLSIVTVLAMRYSPTTSAPVVKSWSLMLTCVPDLILSVERSTT